MYISYNHSNVNLLSAYRRIIRNILARVVCNKSDIRNGNGISSSSVKNKQALE